MRRMIPIFLVAMALAPLARGGEDQVIGRHMGAEDKVIAQAVEYKDGDTVLEGYYAYKDYKNFPADKRPAVLIVHQWKGLGDYEKMRARMLAEMGYVAFAVDIYGKGVRPSTPQEAGKVAGSFKADTALLRRRVRAALSFVAKNKFSPEKVVDPKNIAAIGYCFGGTAVLELARDGAEIAGVASFHGGLAAAQPAKKGEIKARVFALHGADDPHVSPAEVAAFQEEMRASGADWQFASFGGAVHSFTDPGAGNDNSKGAAYNEKADKRSWEMLKSYLAEIFR